MHFFEAGILFNELQHLHKECFHISHNTEQASIYQSAKHTIQKAFIEQPAFLTASFKVVDTPGSPEESQNLLQNMVSCIITYLFSTIIYLRVENRFMRISPPLLKRFDNFSGVY